MSIKADVDRGLEIVAEQKRLKKELEKIQERLEKAGLAGDQVALEDDERDGRQFLATGSQKIVPVIFTADLIMKSFQEGSPAHAEISSAIPDMFFLRRFYAPAEKWESAIDSGKIFRKRADELFGKAAPAFISACLSRDKDGVPKSQIKVDWSRASEVVA